jgi:hypothetical protein
MKHLATTETRSFPIPPGANGEVGDRASTARPETVHAAEPHRCRLELDEMPERTQRYGTVTRLTLIGSVISMGVYSDAVP